MTTSFLTSNSSLFGCSGASSIGLDTSSFGNIPKSLGCFQEVLFVTGLMD